MLRPFSSGFILREASALAFLSGDYRDAAARHEAAQRAKVQSVSPALVEILRAQDRAFVPSEARARNLDALGTPGTVAVITGQQVGLFLGPLYTIYKAASAVALARLIESETGVRAVPVFWLQTEDHDYPEIHHCFVPGPAGQPVRLSLTDDEPDSAAARSSVAQRVLGAEIESLLASLHDLLSPLPHAAEILSLLGAHYRTGQSLAGAFAAVIATLFAGEGLIVFNPRDGGVAKLAAPAHAQTIAEAGPIATALAARGRALHAAGFAEQVHIRAESPLGFFHDPDASGPRFRLERLKSPKPPEPINRLTRRGAEYRLVGGGRSVTEEELGAALAGEPLRFSTSALLRPFLQDTLFPTVAYVGGPGEINYLAQLGPLYAHFNRVQPLVALRARFRVVDDKTRSLARRLGIGMEEAEQSKETILRALLSRSPAAHPAGDPGGHPAPGAIKEALLSDFVRALGSFEALATSIDQNLLEPTRKTGAIVTQAVTRLVDRYARSLLERDTVASERIERLHSQLLPLGEPQERVYGLPYYAAKYGLARFKAAVFAALSPNYPTDPTVGTLDP